MGMKKLSSIKYLNKTITYSTITPDLMWYKFESGDLSGTNLRNYATGDYLALCSASGMLSTTTSAVGSGSLLMNGSTRITLANTALTPFSSTQSQTISIWFNCSSATPNASTIMCPYLLAYNYTYTLDSIAIKNAGTNLLTIERSNFGAQYLSLAGIGTFGINTWQHYAMTVSNNSAGNWTIKNYFNGTLFSTATSTTLAQSSSSSFIGSGQTAVMGYNGDSNFIGNVDDFRVYSYALTATQISSIYNKTG